MKKFLVGAMAVLMLAGSLAMPVEAAQNYQKSDTTALLLSVLMPGTGEWYNRDFEGNFPLTECVVGKLCFCFGISSVVDATAGDGSDTLRMEFWSGANRQ